VESLRQDKHYTYTDYVNWDTEDRYELFDGALHMMSSASRDKVLKFNYWRAVPSVCQMYLRNNREGYKSKGVFA